MVRNNVEGCESCRGQEYCRFSLYAGTLVESVADLRVVLVAEDLLDTQQDLSGIEGQHVRMDALRLTVVLPGDAAVGIRILGGRATHAPFDLGAGRDSGFELVEKYCVTSGQNRGGERDEPGQQSLDHVGHPCRIVRS